MAVINAGVAPKTIQAVAAPPTRAQVSTTTAKPNPAQTLQAANRLVAAPAASARQTSPLDVIPAQWLPFGNSERNFEGRTGFIKVLGGKAQISRNHEQISVKTPQGQFTLKPDKDHAGNVTATTPQGTFSGQITGGGNKYEFHATDGKHSLKIEKKSDCVRFDTKGFGGLTDMAHLNVMDK